MSDRKQMALGVTVLLVAAVALVVAWQLAAPGPGVVVKTASGTIAGQMTDRACRAVPHGAPWADVISRYGWPQTVPSDRRTAEPGMFNQQADGNELDYPIAGTQHSGSFTRLCGLIFADHRGAVDHVWEDLP